MMTGSYDRISAKLLEKIPMPKPFCKAVNGRLMVGTQSMHLHPAARRATMFWRIKRDRS